LSCGPGPRRYAASRPCCRRRAPNRGKRAGGGGEKRETCDVALARRVVEHRGKQRLTERVGCDKVHAAVPHPHRCIRDSVDEPLQARPYRLFGAAPAATNRLRARGTREILQVLGLGIVVQCVRQTIDHGRHAAEIAPFDPGVVVHAHPGQQRNLLAPQTRNPTTAPTGDPDLVRGDTVPATPEKLRNVAVLAHPLTPSAPIAACQVLALPGTPVPSTPRRLQVKSEEHRTSVQTSGAPSNGGSTHAAHRSPRRRRGHHCPFSDLNNVQIADEVSKFLSEKGLDGR
jgi:hypothetical protein